MYSAQKVDYVHVGQHRMIAVPHKKIGRRVRKPPRQQSSDEPGTDADNEEPAVKKQQPRPRPRPITKPVGEREGMDVGDRISSVPLGHDAAPLSPVSPPSPIAPLSPAVAPSSVAPPSPAVPSSPVAPLVAGPDANTTEGNTVSPPPIQPPALLPVSASANISNDNNTLIPGDENPHDPEPEEHDTEATLLHADHDTAL
ncbi:hypothetical protein BV22DRAFT_1135480 [Leucogyrophana mollusca]|uniref:Uncharacterized protein n=1 Tax=Leucogyrophana mollusca TaxID=85980 RepID=A0ACB8AY57_9AGAM|nr:hypothetical protein BV22DRAFT_1135480 [Leucogyrophana mollusca]